VAFSLFAAAEVTYMTYHLDWTVFLFAHTIAEVLDLVAFVAVFAGALWQVATPAGRRSRRAGDPVVRSRRRICSGVGARRGSRLRQLGAATS
jgi:hypothetical protein